MPGRDGTGPLGMGSMTGRKAGFCINAAKTDNQPDYGYGGGRRRGFRGMYYATGLPRWARGSYNANRRSSSTNADK